MSATWRVRLPWQHFLIPRSSASNMIHSSVCSEYFLQQGTRVNSLVAVGTYAPLDVSKHVVLDTALHGHWLAIFILDTSIATISSKPLKL
jgi:hypothetical protein